jgi:hypothetical protein
VPPADIRSTEKLARCLFLRFIESPLLLRRQLSKLSGSVLLRQLTEPAHPARFVNSEAHHRQDLKEYQAQEQEVRWSPLEEDASNYSEPQETDGEQDLRSEPHTFRLTTHITGGGPSACGNKQDENPAVQCMCRVMRRSSAVLERASRSGQTSVLVFLN